MKKQKLIEDNMKLVYHIVSKEYPTYLHDEDIIQSGMLGLCKAADKWDENRGEFLQFAWTCIRYEIIKEFKRRAKHQGVLSLDYETEVDGMRSSLGETIVGDEDVAYVDLSVDSCRINEKEQQIYDLLVGGLSPREIAKKLNVANQFVYTTRRKLKFLRGGNYEH